MDWSAVDVAVQRARFKYGWSPLETSWLREANVFFFQPTRQSVPKLLLLFTRSYSLCTWDIPPSPFPSSPLARRPRLGSIYHHHRIWETRRAISLSSSSRLSAWLPFSLFRSNISGQVWRKSVSCPPFRDGNVSSLSVYTRQWGQPTGQPRRQCQILRRMRNGTWKQSKPSRDLWWKIKMRVDWVGGRKTSF